MIKFKEKGHLYTSVEPDDIKWLSVTGLISRLHEPFDAEAKAYSSSSRKPTAAYPNKWYKVPPEEILAAWESETTRAADLGHWYHGKREAKWEDMDNVVMSQFIDGDKYATNQILEEGIYPEHLMYMLSAEICGQSDLVIIRDGKVYIRDYKTSKEIRRHGFTNRYGTKMMYPPVEHLEDCEYNHYALQLSIYMYIILRHNPNLEPGGLTIEHVKFEIEKEDKYGYPIYKKDDNGEFIIREIEEIEVPYLRKEVVYILDWLKDNR